MIPFPEGKSYDILLADPPWRYDFSKDNSDKIEAHYPTMSIEEICALQVPANDNAVLYLWATAPKLLEAVAVMKAWGFTYKSHMVWDKSWIGMGYWFRGQHELLMVGTKGKFSPPKDKRVSSVLRERRTTHSRKPSIIRTWINMWYPDKTKIELFARKPDTELFVDDSWIGWDVWGLESENRLSKDQLFGDDGSAREDLFTG